MINLIYPEELKKCPFCGSAAEMVEKPHIPKGTEYTPRCTVKSCAGRLQRKWLSRDEARGAWNRRAFENESIHCE